MDSWIRRQRDHLERAEGLQLSLVELVVAACDHSEDCTEIGDLVDGLIETGRVGLTGALPQP